MNPQTLGLRVAGIVFGLASLAQLVRFSLRLEVQVAGCAVPLWTSALAFIILGALSFWMWKLSCSKTN
ncbi:MAG: hypothetical protein ACYC4Q_05280 [Victivallaceae bacterium]